LCTSSGGSSKRFTIPQHKTWFKKLNYKFTLNPAIDYAFCVRPAWAKVSKIPNYSRGCKSLTGKLVMPVSKSQGGLLWSMHWSPPEWRSRAGKRDYNTDSYRYGTDEQKPTYRGCMKRVSKHIFATLLANKLHSADAAGIGRRNKFLPGEISVPRVGIREVSPDSYRDHSSWKQRADGIIRRSHDPMKDWTLSCLKCCKEAKHDSLLALR